MSHETASKATAQPQSEQKASEGGVTMSPPAFQLQAAPIQRNEDQCSTVADVTPGNEGFSDLITNGKADAATAAQVIGAGTRGSLMVDLMRNDRYDIVKAVYANASWSDTDNITCELLQHCTSTDLFDAPNDVLQTMHDSLGGGMVFMDEVMYMQVLTQVMTAKSLLPKEDTCEQEVAEVKKEVFDPKSLKSAADYKSGSKAGTLYGKSQSDSLGAILKSEKTKGSMSYVNANKTTFANEDEYYAALDKRYERRNEVANDKITDNQKSLLEIARKAARDSAYFDQVIASSEKAKAAEIDYSNAQLSNDAYNFSPLLRSRMGKYHQFMVAVGLYTLQKPKPGGQAALRDRPVAHKWSTEHYVLYEPSHKDAIWSNYLKMFKDDSYHSGDIIQDKDKYPWAKKSHFVDKDDKAVTKDTVDTVDKEKTWKNITAYVDTFGYRPNKSSLASEGYDKTEEKRYPNSNKVGISNHIFGNALDYPSEGFLAKADQVNDFVAWEFGVQRNVSGETWHFECTGRPTRTEETGEVK